MSVEADIQRGMFGRNSEKTFIDKILSRQDVESIRELIKKPKLTREDVLEILYLISGVESKLLNYDEWDRYVILKYFVWVREFAKVTEHIFDLEDDLKEKTRTCKNCKGKKEPKKSESVCSCGNFEPMFMMTDRTKKMLLNNARHIEHNLKFLVDLYLNIGRTSLSVNATGIMEILKNKYEISYPQAQINANNQDLGGSFLRLRK